MSGWKFEYLLRDNSLGYTVRTTMDNDRPLAERVAHLEAALAQLTDRYERGATEPADPPGTQCGEPSPYTGDKCQEIKGHIGSHHAGLRDKWERTPSQPVPYRMAEPTNIKAAVISDGTVFTRTDNSSTPWMRLRDWQWCDWETITDPQPYQNCTLTADDPEPPVGSVVRADAGLVSERGVERWNSPWYTNAPTTWAEVADGSVTLLYRGEA